MRKFFNLFIRGVVLSAVLVFIVSFSAPPSKYINLKYIPGVNDSIDDDSLIFPFDDYTNTPSLYDINSPLFLKNPSTIQSTVKYDPKTGKFVFYDKIGDFNYRTPYYMSFDEFISYSNKKNAHEYWMERSVLESAKGETSLIDRLVNKNLIVPIQGFDKIFGSNTINIKPTGNAELIFGLKISEIDNDALPEDLKKSVNFDFDMNIKMGVNGQIGDKMKLGINFDTDATFEFENNVKLAYEGKEDEIIQKIEAGNVTMPLAGSLITGSHNLFGLKTELKFGRLLVTTVFSQQKGESKTIEVAGGATTTPFEITADNYDANRHYFVSQYFRDRYDLALSNLPITRSNINIRKVEVWITNRSGNFENSRNIIAFMDLGEETQEHIYSNEFTETGMQIPSNESNDMYRRMTGEYSAIRDIAMASTVLSTITGFNSGIDYEKVQNARLLSSSEYTFNANLGYISLNSKLNSDEVLAIAFEFENTSDGKIYRVGEFSNEDPPAPEALFLKLLKPTTLSTDLPTWDLMMKNIYSFNAYQVNSQDFRLDIMYRNDKTGSAINYLPAGEINGEILLNVLNLDNLNKNNEPGADGFFDFIDRITINASNGKIIFPVVEPFGSYLYNKITGGSDDPELNRIAEEYIFQELYDQTQSQAKQMAEKNKFFLRGEYRSSGGSEINLNAMNVPEGSVTVTAGGRVLEENLDYTVDYNLGRVTILNQSLMESGTPIQISLESNSMFDIGTKSMIGSRFDYMLTDNFNIGATIMHLHQKPLTTKVNIGNIPISNTIWGADVNFNHEIPFLTKFVDKVIPFVKTKAPSHIDFSGEFAHLIPGHPKILSEEGFAHIDDFEGAKVTIDLKSPSAWKIASTPQGQDMFPEADSINALSYGFNRAKIAWYNVSRDFLSSTNTPDYITNDSLSNHYVREIPEQEIFPDREPQQGIPQFLYVMNLAYYPSEKGPYNYDVEGLNGISAGIDNKGNLNDPGSRWAGMTRDIITNDFEEANIEFIEFWMLDPFIDDENENHTGGDLYFNLGNISEDILRDSRQAFENGLPTSGSNENIDTTVWGRVPILPRITDAFATEPSDAREKQDVGLDGLSTVNEITFFNKYLNSIAVTHGQGSDAYKNALNDPSGDNYLFFKDPYYDTERKGILDRYKNYNNQEGNSTASGTDGNTVTASELRPDMEDINKDYTLTETEAYFQYKIHMSRNEMNIGQNYITDIKESDVKLRNENTETVKWYHFKIPLEEYEKAVGPIQDFKSIRFVRLFMKGWDEKVILRFAKMDLVRGDWRKYRLSMLEGSEGAGGGEITDGQLDINTVNIEENSSREPVNYIMPPNVTREISPNNQYLRQLNEQAISLKITDLSDGDARAAYKSAALDVRQFKRLQMFIHAEAIEGQILNDDDLCAFVRLGSDYKENYYEYEIPLKLTESGYYDKDDEADKLTVWPDENMLDVEFEILQGLKQRRNEIINQGGSIQLTSEYSEYIDDTGRRISITGSPNLSNVRTIMIGVRNRKNESNILPDDGLVKSIEVWMNELRLTEFDEHGGWATRGRLQANLADFSTIAIAGEFSTPGFGSIEKSVNERQKSTDMGYDFSTSSEFGKFFPKKYGVRVPVYFGYSELMSNPEYDPLNPDIKMTTVVKNMSQKERDDHLKISQDYLKRKTFNVTNIRINGNSEKKSKKDNKKKDIGVSKEGERNKGDRNKGSRNRKSKNKAPWHISNWTSSYGFNETFLSNINTEYNVLKIHTGAIAYNYNISPKNVKPFSKVKLFRKKAFRIIRDINFHYAPSLIAFRTDVRKSYNEIQMRNINDTTFILPLSFDKQFTWNRTYDLRYNPTRGLKLTYSANNQSWIDEPDGKIDREDEGYKRYRDAVIDSMRNFGRTTDFHQKISGTWSIPINKLPLLDWTTANARYDADYYWTQNPIALNPDALPGEDSIIDLGNTIRNNQAFQLSTQLNIERLYTKVKYLKEIDNQFKGKKKKKKKKYKDVSFVKGNVRLKKDKARSITHNLRVEDVKLKVTDADGKEVKGETEIINENKVKFISETDVEDVKIEVTGKREIKENALKIISDYTLYTLMSVRNVSLTYSENNGTVLPGYMRDTRYFGLDENKAPGIPFILGLQDSLFAYEAQRHHWLTDDTLMTTPVVYTGDQTYDFKATIKPFTGLRIDLTANRRDAYNERQLWIGTSDTAISMYRTGDFSMSILTIGTAFDKIDTSGFNTGVYKRFLDYRINVAEELANYRSIHDEEYIQNLLNNPDSLDDPVNEYPYGYKSTSKDVLLESFLAAYTNQPVGKFSRDPFPKIPMPNWRLKYDGLTYFDLIRKVFKKVIINHGYRSTYRVASYNLHPDFDFGSNRINDDLSRAVDSIYFSPKYQMDGVMIDEKFIPLLGIDVRWNNDMSTKLEYKQARAMTLSFANNQILETANKEYVIGFGYKIPDLNIPMSIQGNQKIFKSDLNLRIDFTYRDMVTIIRRINEDLNDMSAGQKNISIKVNADYNLDKVTLRLFYDRILNAPRVSTAYKTTNTHIGFSLRFNLANI